MGSVDGATDLTPAPPPVAASDAEPGIEASVRALSSESQQTQTQLEPEPQPHPDPDPDPDPAPGLHPHTQPDSAVAVAVAVAAVQDSFPSEPQHQSYEHQLQHQHQHHQHQHQQQYHNPQHGEEHGHQFRQYDGLSTVPVPVSTVAHHGLQALQAASAAPPIASPTSDHLAQQYAQSATLQMGDAQFAQVATDVVNGNRNGHHTPPNLHGHAQAPSPASPAMNGTPTQQKTTRLRRACDMCSQRKVKCDESGPPCKPCADLNVECTFQRQMKRRGPPNKHAEAARAAKRSRVDSTDASVTMLSLSPEISQGTPDAESIAPWPVLELLVDDFFTYIHPLMPFPHQPTFRQAFAERADRTSQKFLALLASMVGALVASFPRSARSHLKAQHSTDLFPTSVTMIERCRNIALQARGPLFMASQDMTADDAATSYFLSIAAAYTLQYKACKRFMAETMTFVREVSVYRRKGSSPPEPSVDDIASVLSSSDNKPVDHIKDQMTKRIFWVIVAGVRSMTQLGASMNELPLPPPTSQEQYPDQPVEVDDEYIYADQILPQPEGIPSLITGFNRNICVYTTMNELVGVDMCYGMKFFDWNAQKNILGNGLAAAKQATEDLPVHLRVKTEPSQPQPPNFDESGLQYHPPAFPAAQPPNDLRHAFAEEPMRRRELQFEIQKANIYASSLATRSYFVERYLNLRDAELQRRKLEGNGAVDAVEDERDLMVAEERELIVENLLTVLSSISQRNMEPNGASIINKIRQVASTLLDDAPERKGTVAVRAEEYLRRFVDILMGLEKTGGSRAPGPMTAQDEEEELRCWANLREYQLQFAANGGFMGQG
ncbi:hypothetical protein DL766_003390 [Monosporascus sp. MC13-8B]|uniref:Zn(2)-C6 fungal-type domain-containing protein n=1 Tax=Monosporascus cannonballus TaxID=155416 RepID=A0ABY0H389_9PEZI|nr:hypothetical protein DL762_006392 [Monosporascus cannonballus]RYO89067.1 hypothetical protein DL763_005777 [Monosporascus cannonballus]RYP33554.1 hypothetical protein DL766_003390 [Monosporascus sp. MC13-8B]